MGFGVDEQNPELTPKTNSSDCISPRIAAPVPTRPLRSLIFQHGYDTDEDDEDGEFEAKYPHLFKPDSEGGMQVYTRRWLMLFILSSLSATSNLIAFQYASVSHQAERFLDVEADDINVLVEAHFISYLVLSFVGSWLLNTHGLTLGLVGGAIIQAIGTWITMFGAQAWIVPSRRYRFALIGQFVASIGQPFFVNTPPLLAANWFPENERTLATTMAVQANSVGVAIASVLSTMVVRKTRDVFWLNLIVTIVATTLAFLAFVFFAETPPTPPSISATNKESEEGPGLVKTLASLKNINFLLTILGFAVSGLVFNMVPIFMNQTLIPEGYSPDFVGVLGALFIVSGMISSFVIG